MVLLQSLFIRNQEEETATTTTNVDVALQLREAVWAVDEYKDETCLHAIGQRRMPDANHL